MKLTAPLLLLTLLNSVRGATIAAPAAKPTQFITLDIVNAPLAPDGFPRIGVLANGTLPGPPIVATKGQTLVIKVNNKLTNDTMRLSTSINFDGLFIDSNNIFNEGSPFVTTCPVGPGESYTYTQSSPTTGSFWYHSQLSVQAGDGLRGTLIIYDPDDPLRHLYDVDDASTVLTLIDWWHNTSTSSLASYLATQIIPVSDTGLFNARGRYNGGPEVEFAAVSVVLGKRYRFRLVSLSIRGNFIVSIDNHTMTVIETDGVATVPHEVNILNIHAGQRYSLVVTANQPVGNYWINAFIDGGNPAHNLLLNPGILRYKGAPDEEPQTPMTAGPTGADAVMLNEWELVPLVPIPAPEPDFNLTFRTFMPAGITQWEINNISYVPPSVPTLVRVLNGETEEKDFNLTENTFLFPANKAIQIEIIEEAAINEGHPFHLHGMNFWVVKSNGSDIVNTVNPIRRDVVITGSGNIILRFRTDRPGPWSFHCHILYHFAAGLGSVIGVQFDEVGKIVHPTEAWEQLCPAYHALPVSEQ
ncbi:Cu-oxidase-domain-containing protein [Mycena pura]|uniref:Cu-oxidase-domain-containing protein n=1 Tax=Mycena pura TaxID=153505 RepID=A0AAD6XZV5_9AGAR|nr:Cu-oxidase-domain-containing protein [Mycena pura]